MAKKWGCFGFASTGLAYAGGRGGGEHGGLRVTCPFHRRSAYTTCKKWFKVPGPLESDKDSCLRKALTWCNSAREHNRQRTHITDDPAEDPACLQPYAALVAAKIPECDRPAKVSPSVLALTSCSLTAVNDQYCWFEYLSIA